MQRQKTYLSHTHGGWFKRELKFLAAFFGLIFSFNFVFSSNTSALYTPTLSVSMYQANLQVKGNSVINSTDKTTEIPLYLFVDTNNKTGYTAILNSETDETALVDTGSISGMKIDSIDTNKMLTNFSQNTWGYKVGNAANYSPIPALSMPSQILKTTEKTNGNEINNLKLGMKLGETLESGSYRNKLIFSILTNNYERIAVMTRGLNFRDKLESLETVANKVEHFKKSTTPPTARVSTLNIEDENSDYEIKLWLDPADKTAYYYAEPEKVYLNEDSSNMFDSMSKLVSLDLSNFDTSNVTNMEAMFSDMRNLTSLNLSNFDTSKATDMYGMFSGTTKLTSLDLSNFDTSNVTNMSNMFYYMYSLTSLNISNFDTSNVTDMSRMFSDIPNLISLNVSNFDTSKVTDMNNMFSSVSSLTSLNVSNFDTSKVTDMNNMFSDIPNLISLNVSNFDTSKVTDMSDMFSGAENLISLNLSNFDTSNVTNMYRMFNYMPNLTSLNLSNFDTSKVTDMSFMFSGTPKLASLDLSNFDTSNVTNMSHMFALAEDEDITKDKLERIYVNNDFNTSQLTNFYDMFRNRKKLRGGNGSYLSDPSTADKTWLRVDRPGVQGYFTRKS